MNTLGMTLAQKLQFYSRRNRTTGCLEWIGSLTTAGRGQLGWRGKICRAHRLAYEVAYASVPKGKCVLHRCDNLRCIEPRHLFAGTQVDNMMDRTTKNRTASKLTIKQVRALKADTRSASI